MRIFRGAPLAFAAALALGTFAAPVWSQSPDAAKMKEAGGHFERGVGLYKEADYRGALVEFRRAYELAPNATVRFNLGQAQYQLRDYPAALTTFEAYLAEAPANAPNRAEAEGAVTQLRGRVGTIRVAGPAGAEVLLQDEPVGHLPFAPIRVPVGSHKLTLVPAGGTRASRTVDVVGGATVDVTFTDTPAAGPTAGAPATTGPATAAPPTTAGSSATTAEPGPWRTVAWVVTGVAVAGAITTGVVAQVSSSKLTDLKKSDGTTRGDLDTYHDRMRTFAVTSDVLTGVAVLAGGAALYLTLSPTKNTAVQMSPTSLRLQGSF